MKTLVAMISFGKRDHLTDVSFGRAAKWASRHGYSIVLIKQALHGPERLPHYGKLRVHHAFPGYDRYCIIDDDLLLTGSAPSLPEIPTGLVGLVPDSEQAATKNPDVKWTGNTGFILALKESLDLLDTAYQKGDDPTVWGIADQGALNSVAWAQERVFQLDALWNYQAAQEYFLRGQGWERWRTSRLYRLSFYFGLLFHWPLPALQNTRRCYGLHLIRTPYPRFFDRILPKF